jgi:hypothetical protein
LAVDDLADEKDVLEIDDMIDATTDSNHLQILRETIQKVSRETIRWITILSDHGIMMSCFLP